LTRDFGPEIEGFLTILFFDGFGRRVFAVDAVLSTA
jgi:hypothetical protein